MGNKKRQYNLDFLRIISMAAVVVLHTAAFNWDKIDVQSLDWNVLNCYDSLVRWSVPVFVMISGALFLDPQKEVSIKGLWSRNVIRIVAIILVWGGIYALLYGSPLAGVSVSGWQFIKTWLLGHYHMWFLYMIMGLYVVTPLLRCIAANKTALNYYLAVSFAVGSLIPAICSFGHFGLLKDFLGKMQIQLVCGYSFYFMLGYKMNATDLSKKNAGFIIALGVIGVIYTATMTSYFSFLDGSGTMVFYDYLSPNVCVTAMGVFVLGKLIRFSGEKTKRMIISLSGASLGVYLIHPIIIYILADLGITTMSFSPILSVPVLAAIEISASFAGAWAIRKIPLIGKWTV